MPIRIKQEKYLDLNIRIVDNKENMTATAFRIIDYSFDIDNNINNTFIEFWIGRRFIGGICGMELHGEFFLDILLVNEKYRNQGYGTKLIEYSKNNYKKIVVESTPEATGFYKKCGFSKMKNQSSRIYANTKLMQYNGK